MVGLIQESLYSPCMFRGIYLRSTSLSDLVHEGNCIFGVSKHLSNGRLDICEFRLVFERVGSSDRPGGGEHNHIWDCLT